MNAAHSTRTPLRTALGLVCALALAACAVTPPDPNAALARQDFDKLAADPNVAAKVPETLATTRAAVEAAEHPLGDASDAATLAFVAQKRVDVLRADAAAAVDSEAFDALEKRRKSIRHGDDAITTLATDAFDATPRAISLTPVGANAKPLPPPGAPLPTAAPPPPSATPIYVDPATEPLPPGPLLRLQNGDFSADAAPLPGARRELDGLLASFARWSGRPVTIAYAGRSQSGARRAAAVRSYLVSKGMPGSHLICGSSDLAGPNEILVDFARAPGMP